MSRSRSSFWDLRQPLTLASRVLRLLPTSCASRQGACQRRLSRVSWRQGRQARKRDVDCGRRQDLCGVKHGPLECVDCHKDLAKVQDFPHPEKLARVDCASCHGEEGTSITTAFTRGPRRRRGSVPSRRRAPTVTASTIFAAPTTKGRTGIPREHSGDVRLVSSGRARQLQAGCHAGLAPQATTRRLCAPIATPRTACSAPTPTPPALGDSGMRHVPRRVAAPIATRSTDRSHAWASCAWRPAPTATGRTISIRRRTRSMVNASNRLKTCRQTCHPSANENFAQCDPACRSPQQDAQSGALRNRTIHGRPAAHRVCSLWSPRRCGSRRGLKDRGRRSPHDGDEPGGR